MPDATAAYEQLLTELRETALLDATASLLHWDERTGMPPRGAEHRANQISLIARMVHERATAPRVGELLAAVEGSGLVKDPLSDAAVNVRETRRTFDRSRKVPAKLVEEMSRTFALAHDVWAEARKKSEFARFRPWLEKVMHLKRQEAACIGHPSGDPYDGLLDDYEPGETAASIQRTFDALRPPLVELLGRIVDSGKKAPLEILERRYPAAGQEQLSREAAAAIGFDFDAGRLDVSVHPFCTEIGPGDTRMTTRYDEKYFGDAFFGVLHETGHALYNQGLPAEHFGTPRGSYLSTGIHESQSRMWENLVGRGRAFWRRFLPRAREVFAETLRDVSDDDWYRAINDVRPSYIRTESDETTYNLHVMLRFDLEQAMLRGDLSPADLPGAWNEKFQSYLGLAPPDDARGCLQDVHWSEGMLGYFPTYTLGNLYAAQLFEQARQELGDLDAMFAEGEFAPLLGWLREKVHRHGKTYRAPDLVQHATGKPLTAEPLLRHLSAKAAEVYGV